MSSKPRLPLQGLLSKSELAALVLLLMVLSTLAIAYWALDDSVAGGGADGLSPNDVTIVGRATDVRETKTGGHLMIKLDTTDKAVFVPSSVAKRAVKVKKGDLLRISGSLEEYGGKQEIRIKDPSGLLMNRD
jgi:hypothetical protein